MSNLTLFGEEEVTLPVTVENTTAHDHENVPHITFSAHEYKLLIWCELRMGARVVRGTARNAMESTFGTALTELETGCRALGGTIAEAYKAAYNRQHLYLGKRTK